MKPSEPRKNAVEEARRTSLNQQEIRLMEARRQQQHQNQENPKPAEPEKYEKLVK